GLVVAVLSVTATTGAALYALSLHDALPILDVPDRDHVLRAVRMNGETANDDPGLEVVVRRAYVRLVHHDLVRAVGLGRDGAVLRSEEHTSELQSRENLVCRLLLEKQKRPRSDRGGRAARQIDRVRGCDYVEPGCRRRVVLRRLCRRVHRVYGIQLRGLGEVSGVAV